MINLHVIWSTFPYYIAIILIRHNLQYNTNPTRTRASMGYYQCFLCNYESSYRKNVVLSPTLYLTCVFTYRDMLGHCCWGNNKFKGFWTCVCVCVCVCVSMWHRAMFWTRCVGFLIVLWEYFNMMPCVYTTFCQHSKHIPVCLQNKLFWHVLVCLRVLWKCFGLSAIIWINVCTGKNMCNLLF